jgi:hypothetical protein
MKACFVCYSTEVCEHREPELLSDIDRLKLIRLRNEISTDQDGVFPQLACFICAAELPTEQEINIVDKPLFHIVICRVCYVAAVLEKRVSHEREK